MLTCAATWMSFENVPRERSQAQKATYHTIPFIGNVHNQQTESRLVVARSRAGAVGSGC